MIETQISPDLLTGLRERAHSFEAVVMRLDTPNKNGRTYPTDVMVNALAKVQYPVLGCFMDDLNQGFIPLNHVSHKVLDMRIDGDQVIARILILPALPHGKVLQSIYDLTGADFRTAGQAMVDPNGVVTQFHFLSIGALPKGKGA